MKAKTKQPVYTIELGGENFSIYQPAPSDDPDIWNVFDSNAHYLTEFEADPVDMLDQQYATEELTLALLAMSSDDEADEALDVAQWEGDFDV